MLCPAPACHAWPPGAPSQRGVRRQGPLPHRAQGFAAAAAAALAPRRGKRTPPKLEDPVFSWLGKALKESWTDAEVLDAGTGPDSLQFLAGLPARSITAVTACEGMRTTIEEDVSDYLDAGRDRVLLGNWQDEAFLKGATFDVVLADYLLGAVDFFSPYFQVGMLKRLARATRPGGLLVLLGREPEELEVADETSQLAVDIQCFRDAVILLGRQHPYREMPRLWVAEQLWQQGLKLERGRRFPRRLDVEKVERNLAWAEEELERVPDQKFRGELKRHLEHLRTRVAANLALRKGHMLGEDYALILRKPT